MTQDPIDPRKFPEGGGEATIQRSGESHDPTAENDPRPPGFVCKTPARHREDAAENYGRISPHLSNAEQSRQDQHEKEMTDAIRRLLEEQSHERNSPSGP